MSVDAGRGLRLFERDALAALVVLAGVAFVWPGGGVRGAAAVAAGGALAWFSYWSTKSAVAGASARGGRVRPVRALVKIFTRYGILALAAYVILARLRLHPVGVLAGTSAPVIAAAAAAIRSLGPRDSLRAGR